MNPTEHSADCLFCKIANGQIKADVVEEHPDWLAFRDINPQAPVHVLLIPRKHVVSLAELEDDALAVSLLQAVRQLSHKLDLDKNGYRLVTNVGQHGGQSVFHLHFHILGQRQMGWPPG